MLVTYIVYNKEILTVKLIEQAPQIHLIAEIFRTTANYHLYNIKGKDKVREIYTVDQKVMFIKQVFRLAQLFYLQLICLSRIR